MKAYEQSTYGDRIAEIYDDLYSKYDPTAVDLLAGLARDGVALELGIGTGRIALPLQEKGITVMGIDTSPVMVSKLKVKPGGAEIEVFMHSFSDFHLDQRFQLIYVVFNTFFNLLTQEEQVKCFRSVSRNLLPEGTFVMEVFVPDLARFTDHQTVRVVNLGEDEVQLETSQVDPVAQQVTAQHLLLSKDGTCMFPVRLRYAWPSELDFMAQIAGLSLRSRWGSWSNEEFTKDSKNHISVYGYTR